MRYAVALACALSFVACSREAPDDLAQSGPSQSTTVSGQSQPVGGQTNNSTMNPVLPPEKDNPAARVGGAAEPEQEVHLLEYQINMPDTLRAGKTVFQIDNAGKENHAFEVEGNGVHTKTDTLTRGNTTTLTVDLKPGTYTIYCPVDGHKGKGMTRTVTVK
jgi:plastocyanin